MTRYLKTTTIALIFLLVALLISAVPASADQHVISGQIVNQTPGAEPPSDLQVLLSIFEDGAPVGQLSTITDAEGFFVFEDVPRILGLRYLLHLQYQDAQYQTEMDPASAEPVQIVVYDSTSDLASLSVLDDTIMVTREPDQYDRLTVRQVVRVRNESLQTFVPSFGDPGAGMMNFLRVSMPAGFSEMTIRSDLQGGQVIPVDRGVGITTAVPPGIHAIVFSYTAPYERSDLIFEPLYPQGADMVRVLVREDVGKLIGADLREEAPVTVSGSSFRVYSIGPVPIDNRVTLGFTDLPQAPWTTTIADAFTTQWEVTAIIPGVTALILLFLLGYAWRLQKRDPCPVTATILTANIQSQPDQMELLQQIVTIDERREQGEIPDADHKECRSILKRKLLSRALKDASSA